MRFARKYAIEPSYFLAGKTLDNIGYIFRSLTAQRCLGLSKTVFGLWADGFTPILKSGSVYHVTLSSTLIVVVEDLYRLQIFISDTLERSHGLRRNFFLVIERYFVWDHVSFCQNSPLEPRTSVENPHTKTEIYPMDF